MYMAGLSAFVQLPLAIYSPFGFAFARIPLLDVESWSFNAASKEFRFTFHDGRQKRASHGWVVELDLEELTERLRVVAPGRVYR